MKVMPLDPCRNSNFCPFYSTLKILKINVKRDLKFLLLLIQTAKLEMLISSLVLLTFDSNFVYSFCERLYSWFNVKCLKKIFFTVFGPADLAKFWPITVFGHVDLAKFWRFSYPYECIWCSYCTFPCSYFNEILYTAFFNEYIYKYSNNFRKKFFLQFLVPRT